MFKTLLQAGGMDWLSMPSSINTGRPSCLCVTIRLSLLRGQYSLNLCFCSVSHFSLYYLRGFRQCKNAIIVLYCKAPYYNLFASFRMLVTEERRFNEL